jgi:hypothetical protein
MSTVPFHPEALKVGLSAIAGKPLFCTWTLVPNHGKPEKPSKVPCVRGGQWLTGGFKDPDLSFKLMSLDEAIHAVNQHGHAGVGLVFMPDCGVVGLDLDHCIVDDQFIGTQEQQEAFNAFKQFAFIERSQSGTGLHAIALGDAATNKVDGTLELFGNKNFLALTGSHGFGIAAEMPVTEIESVDELVCRLKGATKRIIITDHDLNSDLIAHLKRAEGQESIDLVRSALCQLDPSMSRDQWRNVVWAVRHGLGDTPEALELADQWSKGAINA